MRASVGLPASFGPRSSSAIACSSIACASARYFRSCSVRSSRPTSRSDASTARSKVLSSRCIIVRSSAAIRSAASATSRSSARSATPRRSSYDESSSASYESACEWSFPGVSGLRRAKSRKPLPPTFMTTSFVSEGFAPRASRRSRTVCSWPSVSRRCSRYAAESSGSPAMSGAVRSCASACSSIEWASVRYFVSCSWMSAVIAPPVASSGGSYPHACPLLALELGEEGASVGEAVAAQLVAVAARVSAQDDEPRSAQRREVVVGRRSRQTRRGGQLVEARRPGGEAAEHRHAPLVAERAAERERARPQRVLAARRLVADGVADQARVAVLAEQQPRARGEVREEDDARQLRLRLVR